MLRLFLSLTAVILSSVSAFADELKDIKSPVDYPAPHTWIILTAFALIVLFNIVGYIFWKNRLSLNKKNQILTPGDMALRDLKELEKKSLLPQGRIDAYYKELSDILRKYVEQRFGIKAPEMTTDEFIVSLKDSDKFDKHNTGLLKDFLSLADMVKFAKHVISKEEAVKSFEEVYSFVSQTKEPSS